MILWPVDGPRRIGTVSASETYIVAASTGNAQQGQQQDHNFVHLEFLYCRSNTSCAQATLRRLRDYIESRVVR